jgi:hypothetical protein
MEIYGIGEQEAKAFTNAMIEANNATANIRPSLDVFGDLYNATLKLNKATKELSDLQWE